MSMDRRSFFHTIPFICGAGIVSAMVPSKSEAIGFVEQPIVKWIRIPVDCDLTGMSIEDGISGIIEASSAVPKVYRVTCSPYQYLYAKEVCEWLKTNVDLCVEARCDQNQTDHLAWYLEGGGIGYWSSGT